MGRSRGGLTSKIHALVDAEGRPVALKITEGQAHDGRSAADMLGGLGAGQILLGDRAYDSDGLRARMAEQGAWANVKPMPNRKQVLAFSPFLYKYRNLVDTATWLSASSARSSTSEPSPRATTRIPTTSWPASNSQPCVSGCVPYESAT